MRCIRSTPIHQESKGSIKVFRRKAVTVRRGMHPFPDAYDVTLPPEAAPPATS